MLLSAAMIERCEFICRGDRTDRLSRHGEKTPELLLKEISPVATMALGTIIRRFAHTGRRADNDGAAKKGDSRHAETDQKRRYCALLAG
ncbi:MAG: hypothetical protein K2Y37_21305 [Pirellulales bacterium]|nr:hypothetical protein [Pirellulales bacterium]